MKKILLSILAMSSVACTHEFKIAEPAEMQVPFHEKYAQPMTEEMEAKVGQKKLKEWDGHLSDDTAIVEIYDENRKLKAIVIGR